jgi:ABC-type molybdate transport system substrate-binding protein
MDGDSPETPLPEIPAGRADDLHGLEYRDEADLVLFVAGNQFMVMDELLTRFREEAAHVGRVFYETLPPGLELRQILAGGARFRDITLTGRPDVYTSVSEDAMDTLKARGLIADYEVYLHNRIALVVAGGNPLGIRGVQDLGRADVRVSQPGDLEDITLHVRAMYRDAGGVALEQRIMEEKRAEGTTLLTVVHHRETPLRLRLGTADVGPVWATEVEHARRQGLDVEAVEVGEELDRRSRINYCAAVLSDAPNPLNAKRFLDFLTSPEAQDIYASHGFVPHTA